MRLKAVAASLGCVTALVLVAVVPASADLSAGGTSAGAALASGQVGAGPGGTDGGDADSGGAGSGGPAVAGAATGHSGQTHTLAPGLATQPVTIAPGLRYAGLDAKFLGVGATGMAYLPQDTMDQQHVMWVAEDGTVTDTGIAVSWNQPLLPFPGGADVLAVPTLDSFSRVTSIDLVNMPANTPMATVGIPAGDTVRYVTGSTVVVQDPSVPSGFRLLHADGTSTPVAGSTTLNPVGPWDAGSFLVRQNVSLALVDVATGALTVFGGDPLGGIVYYGLTATTVLAYDIASDKVVTAPRAGGAWTVPGAVLPYPPNWFLTGTPQQILFTPAGDHGLRAIAYDGSGPVSNVLSDVIWANRLADGSLMALAGQPGSMGIYHITQPVTGPPVAVAVATVPRPVAYTNSIALAGRRLTTVDDSINPLRLRQRSLGGSGEFTVGPATTLATSPAPWACNGGFICLPPRVGAGYTAWVAQDATGAFDAVVVGPDGLLRTVPMGRGQPDIRFLTGRYLAYVDFDTFHLDIVDLLTGATVQRPTPGGALWGEVYWNESDTPGVLLGENLRTGQITNVSMPSPCIETGLQVADTTIAQVCGNQLTVLETTSHHTYTRSTDGTEFLVGDGFLALSDMTTGALSVVDMRDPVPAPRALGESTQPLAFDGRTWSVDAYGGQAIGFVRVDRSVRVVPVGVTTSPVASAGAMVRTSFGGNVGWNPLWSFTKPVTWTLTVRDGGGATVYGLSGSTPVNTVGGVRWNGRGLSPRSVTRASYTWTLVATPADGIGAPLTLTGTVSATPVVPVPPTHH